MLAAAALLALTLAAHWPALSAGFIWDDDYWLSWNPVVKAGQAPWGYWVSTELADYFPVTGTFFWLQQRLWGNAPAGYHAVNLALHALAVLALWRVLRVLAAPGAYVAALVFAVHPVTVASAGWVTEQKNTLSMALMLASLCAWLRFDCAGHETRFDDRRQRGWYAAALLLAGLAMLAKSSVVILPGVLLGCAWWRRGRLGRSDLTATLPFWLLAAAVAAVTMFYQLHNYMELEDGPANLGERLVLASRAVWFYLGKALLPVRLAMIYPRWDVHTITPAGLLAALSLPAAAAVLAAGARRPWGRPLALGLGYYLLALLPVLGLVDMGFMVHSYVADHWHYLALPGVIALAVGLAWRLLGPRGRALRTVGLVLALAIVGVLSVLTHLQARVYRGPIPMWQHTLKINPAALGAHAALATALADAGRYDEAIQQYLAIRWLRPDWTAATHLNIGLLHNRQEHYERAAEQFRLALAINPRQDEARAGLAVACANLGAGRARQGDYEAAARHYGEAVELMGDDAELRYWLGWSLIRAGRPAEAVEHLQRAVQANPDRPEAHFHLAAALADTGRPAPAAEHFRRAMALLPEDPLSAHSLAWLLATTDDAAVRDGTEALRLAELARRLGWADPVWLNLTLSAAFAELGRFQEAQAAARAALVEAQARRQENAAEIQALLEYYGRGQTYRDFLHRPR